VKVIKSVDSLQNELKYKVGFVIGFVPTMGYLHQGHISLIEQCVHENDITIVSIFVNPKQFNDSDDLKNYPRNIRKDVALLEKSGVDLVFIPPVKEIYPDSEEEYFSFGHLEEIMEGKYRPGHFNGVAQVVSRLFKIVKPSKAYFGLKDFQQLAIIKKLVQILDMHIDIIPCPIVREKDGLAMSSRNVLLKNEERKSASRISQTLFESRNFAKNHSVEETKNWVVNTVNKDPNLEVEYFEIVDDTELLQIQNWDDKTQSVGCIAVKTGNVRLIDNILF